MLKYKLKSVLIFLTTIAIFLCLNISRWATVNVPTQSEMSFHFLPKPTTNKVNGFTKLPSVVVVTRRSIFGNEGVS